MKILDRRKKIDGHQPGTVVTDGSNFYLATNKGEYVVLDTGFLVTPGSVYPVKAYLVVED
jgi:hypothetical protein